MIGSVPLQVLQCFEQLLKQGNLLTEAASKKLPIASPAGLFFQSLSKQCPRPPTPGHIFRYSSLLPGWASWDKQPLEQ